MRYVAITLHIPFLGIHLDLDVPWQMPIPLFLNQALPSILAQKGHHLSIPKGRMVRLVKHVYERPVPLLTHTFRGSGIYDGHILVLEVVSRPPWKDPYRFFLEEALETQEDEGVSVAEAERIYLAQTRIRLGRHDLHRRYTTDVDLSVFPGGRHVSRRHALIQWYKGHFYLYDRGSRNHTYLNGQPLTPGQAYALRPGDRVSFAKRLHFVFHDTHQEQEEGYARASTSSPASTPVEKGRMVG